MLGAVLLLLSLYLVGTVEVTSFHNVLHSTDGETGLHSAVNESNACHKSIYHNKKGESCKHKSHVTTNNKCPLCHLSLQTFEFFIAKPVAYHTLTTTLTSGEVHASTIGEVISLLPSRAPPLYC